MGDTDVRVGGVWLSGVTVCGDLAWSHRWPGGCYEASWFLYRLGLPGGTLPQFLRRGQIVEVFAGSRVWQGIMGPTQTADGGWEMTAYGLAAEGERYDALSGTGASTSIPNVAIDEAIARGLPWKRSQDFSDLPLVDGDTTDALNSINAVLDAWCDEHGNFWGVDADGYVFHYPLPTEPTWTIPPGPQMPGPSDEGYADMLHGRYIRSSDGTYQTVTSHDTAAHDAFGHAELPVDLTGYGPITTIRAQSIADGIMSKGRSRLGWTDSIEPAPGDLLTLGGVAADFRHVTPFGGVVVRQHGALDPTTWAPRTMDVVLGETSYSAADGTLSLSPMEKEVSNLTEAVERATGGAPR